MKTTLILAVVLLAGCAPPGPDPEVMIAAANDLDDRFIAAFNSQDLDAMMECYHHSPDVVTYDVGSMQIKGWDAVKVEMAHTFESMKGGTLSLTSRNQIVLGDGVVGHGTWHWSMPLPDGTSIEMNGRYTDVKALRDGKWVYLVDHASVPMPPPEEEME